MVMLTLDVIALTRVTFTVASTLSAEQPVSASAHITDLSLRLSETHHHLRNDCYRLHEVCASGGFWKRTARRPRAKSHLERLRWSRVLTPRLLDGAWCGCSTHTELPNSRGAQRGVGRAE